MDDIQSIMIFALALSVLALFLSIPSYIAKKRGVSSENQKTVTLLAILGLFFGVTWLVALVLACTYPPAPRRLYKPIIRQRSSDRASGASARDLDAELEEQLGVPARENCENCDKAIGKLETPSVWKDHIVCADCYNVLSKQTATTK